MTVRELLLEDKELEESDRGEATEDEIEVKEGEDSRGCTQAEKYSKYSENSWDTWALIGTWLSLGTSLELMKLKGTSENVWKWRKLMELKIATENTLEILKLKEPKEKSL